MIAQLGFSLIFALWLLDIFDMDMTGPGNHWVKSFIIAALVVYWTIGRYMINDFELHVFGGVFLLLLASLYKSRYDK